MDDCYRVQLQVCTKFFSYVRIQGRISLDKKSNIPVTVVEDLVVFEGPSILNVGFNLPSPGVTPPINNDFLIEFYWPDEDFPDELSLVFKMTNGVSVRRRLGDLRDYRMSRYRSQGIGRKFKDLIGHKGSLLDIGGRARSGVDRSKHFEQEVVVFDIVDGPNVDVVG